MNVRLLLRLLAATTALLIALGGAACGGDDDGDGGGDGTPAAQQQERDGDEGGGGADGSGRGGKGSGGAGSGGDGPAFSGDREQARAGKESVDGVYGNMRAAVERGVAQADVPVRDTLDAAEGNDALTGLCDLMSRQAKRQTVVYARRSAGLADVEWSCEKAVGLLLRRSQQAGGLKRSLRAEVVGVNAKGDRATATIRFGKGPLSSVPLVKEDGEWKLGASPAGGGGD